MLASLQFLKNLKITANYLYGRMIKLDLSELYKYDNIPGKSILSVTV